MLLGGSLERGAVKPAITAADVRAAAKLGDAVPTSDMPSMAALRLPPLSDFEPTSECAHALRLRLRREHSIEAPVIAWQGALWVRVSAALYNSADDYAALAQAVRSLAGGTKSGQAAAGKAADSQAAGGADSQAAAGKAADSQAVGSNAADSEAAGSEAATREAAQPEAAGSKVTRSEAAGHEAEVGPEPHGSSAEDTDGGPAEPEDSVITDATETQASDASAAVANDKGAEEPQGKGSKQQKKRNRKRGKKAAKAEEAAQPAELAHSEPSSSSARTPPVSVKLSAGADGVDVNLFAAGSD